MSEFGESDLQRQPNPERANYQPETPGGTPPANAPTPAVAQTTPPQAGRQSENGTRGKVHSIHYELSYVVRNPERGTKGAIVLLHDLPGGAFVWSDLLPTLAETGRAVYAFDMLGYGQSSRPWPSDTSIWGHADSMTFALQQLGMRDIVLAGLGLGGGVAQILATRLYREGVAKLALLDTYAYNYAMAPNWPMPDMAAHQDPEAPFHAKVDDTLKELRTTLPQGSANPDAISGQRLDDYVNQWNSDVGKQLLFQHIRLLFPNYQNSPSSDLHELTIPTLILWGEQDSVTPLSLGQRLAEEIPGAALKMIPNAGHMVLDDAPQAVARALSDFAGKV